MIPKVIKEAGFTASEVVVVAEGTVVRKEGWIELDVPGLAHPFVLAGGTRAEDLTKRTDLAGKKLRITGKLHPEHAGGPPGLTVDEFQTVL